jgi:hypothetical protein
MSSWRKRLAEMANDANPCNYTYNDACGLLKALGFSLASRSGTSHRKWRLKVEGKPAVIVGLVEHGSGPVRKEYILDMIEILRRNNLLPPGIERL